MTYKAGKKDNPPSIVLGVIEQVTLEEVALSDHVLQGADGAREETGAGWWDSGLKTSPALPHVSCRNGSARSPKRIIGFLTPMGLVEFFARMHKDAFKQGFALHVVDDPVRTGQLHGFHSGCFGTPPERPCDKLIVREGQKCVGNQHISLFMICATCGLDARCAPNKS